VSLLRSVLVCNEPEIAERRNLRSRSGIVEIFEFYTHTILEIGDYRPDAEKVDAYLQLIHELEDLLDLEMRWTRREETIPRHGSPSSRSLKAVSGSTIVLTTPAAELANVFVTSPTVVLFVEANALNAKVEQTPLALKLSCAFS
jgi:hypothetical protein